MDDTRIAPKSNPSSFSLSSYVRMIKPRSKGIYAALASAMFLGMTPIFGKQAILLGVSPLAVVAFRTVLAAIFLLMLMGLFYRRYLFIYPAGLLGCLIAGLTNGLGSLFYYSALGRIDAGVGQLLYSLYPLFLVFWLSLDRQTPSRLTMIRIAMALPAVYLLTQFNNSQVDMIGVIEMLAASALYALHLPINQRVLYDMPAPTVTVYTLIAMSAIVVPTYLLSSPEDLTYVSLAWRPMFGLTMVTFLSRIMLFLGVKHIGGMQTALLGLSELVVALLFAHLWLGEWFSTAQWIGAILLMFSLSMVIVDKTPPKKRSGGWLSWLHPPGIPN